MRSQDEMIALNRTQAAFYDKVQAGEDAAARKGAGSGYSENESINWLSRVWATLRDSQAHAVERSGAMKRVHDLQTVWMAEKQGRNFFEIGCFTGSRETFQLIENSAFYTGIDLSEAASGALRRKVEDRGLMHKASILCGDFLAYTPPAGVKFDFIYAHGVLHHFENPAPVFAKIREMISNDGVLVFVEPVAINPVLRLIRAAYRPFQSDASWEWPFQENTVDELTKRFKVADGLGWGKASTPMSVLTALPLIGPAIFPLYRRTILHEISTGPDTRAFWHNSMVLAKCQPR